MNAEAHQKMIESYPLAPTRTCPHCHVEKLVAYFDGDVYCLACRRKRGKEQRDRSWQRQIQKVRG